MSIFIVVYLVTEIIGRENLLQRSAAEEGKLSAGDIISANISECYNFASLEVAIWTSQG